MKIYINDIPVRITNKHREKKYDIIVNSHDDLIQIDRLKGRVLIENKSSETIDHLLKIMTEKKHKKVKYIDIIPKLDAFKEQNVSEDSADADHESNPTLLKLRNDVERLHAEVNAIEAHARRRATRLFAQIDGEPEE